MLAPNGRPKLSSSTESQLPARFLRYPLPQFLVGIVQALRRLRHKIEGQSELIQKADCQLAEMRKALSENTRLQESLEALSQQQKLLSERHYQEYVIAPLTNRLCGVVDLCGEQLSQNSGEAGTESHMDAFQAVRSELIDLLSQFGVEIRFASPGDTFDPKWMKQGTLVPTTSKSNHQKVVRTIRCGFMRGDTVTRPALVAIWQFEASSDSLFDSSDSQGDLT